ncbi:MAG TPA: ATP-binding protein [Candidatus Saccharimonadales bacterium]|nr:ATP-binding protein [Candidatus Saccharimonadales bacterium]
MLSGGPASGKSTYGKLLAAREAFVVCSRDEVRRELRRKKPDATEDEIFLTFVLSILNELRQKRNVVADATFSNWERRKQLIAHVMLFDVSTVIELHHLQTPLDECKRRNAARPRRERVPEADVERLHREVTMSLFMHPPGCPVLQVSA